MTRGEAALPCEEIAARGGAGWEVASGFSRARLLLEEERKTRWGRRRWRINER